MALVTREEAAVLCGVPYKTFRDKICKRPDFPTPAQYISQKVLWWDAKEIEQWKSNNARKKFGKR